MHFTKMEGAGNDYVYVNGFTEHIPEENKPGIVRRFSDRHFGIGGDGVIFINKGKKADLEMEMYNADGTRGEMCGNGIRCVGKYAYDRGMVRDKDFTVESFGKVKYLTVTEVNADGSARMLRVDMGAPILEAGEIPVASEKSPVVDEPIEVGGKTFRMTCVSMGNPHCVVFVDDVDTLDLPTIGPLFEHHPRFPKRTNTEFVQVLAKDRVKIRVWERGTGETLACGTGCCATGTACVLNGKTEPKITVEVKGGEIGIEWDREKNIILMTGPATEVFSGEIRIGD
ncbi:MAG: diaminopimelate epimerase [Lachnospiraceae bacterium]|nr:diaminopimelate epimerase [Lachnospiraceae bacterium]